MKNENNAATVAGMVATEPKRYDCCGELFYAFDLSVRRMSGAEDLIPVNMPVVLCDEVNVGDELCLVGQCAPTTKWWTAKAGSSSYFSLWKCRSTKGTKTRSSSRAFSANLPCTAQRRSDETSATCCSRSIGIGSGRTMFRSLYGAERRGTSHVLTSARASESKDGCNRACIRSRPNKASSKRRRMRYRSTG